MMGGVKAHYDGIKAFSETDFMEDLKNINIPVLITHGDGDQIVPTVATGVLSAKILKNATPRSIRINADLLSLLSFFKGTAAAAS
jgi:non-heme chloroperoxidase